MAYIVNTTTDDRYFLTAIFQNTPPDWQDLWVAGGQAFPYVNTRAGLPVPLDRTATHVLIHKSESHLPDFFGIETSIGVSTAFKAIVEHLEPNVHQFIPLQIERKDGGPVEGEYWLFVICRRVDTAIDPEHSNVVIKNEGANAWYYAPKSMNIAIKKLVIGHFHAWVDRRFTWTFFSDELIETLDEAKMIGPIERRRVEEY